MNAVSMFEIIIPISIIVVTSEALKIVSMVDIQLSPHKPHPPTCGEGDCSCAARIEYDSFWCRNPWSQQNLLIRHHLIFRKTWLNPVHAARVWYCNKGERGHAMPNRLTLHGEVRTRLKLTTMSTCQQPRLRSDSNHVPCTLQKPSTSRLTQTCIARRPLPNTLQSDPEPAGLSAEVSCFIRE